LDLGQRILAFQIVCENGIFKSHLCINASFLPRQARDKHRENSKGRSFSQVSNDGASGESIVLYNGTAVGSAHIALLDKNVNVSNVELKITGENSSCVPFCTTNDHLPRQARDKHRE
jgi:hypothetical protein